MPRIIPGLAQNLIPSEKVAFFPIGRRTIGGNWQHQRRGGRRQVDDASALGHALRRLLTAEERSLDVDGEEAVEQAALRTLSLAVYPPEVAASWPGRAIEWAPVQWGVVGWDADGAALCYVGVVLRDARWNERAVKVGGIGGVKTHPAFRGRGFATTAIQRALAFFHEQGDVDFGLLVCEPGLVPFYERLDWRRFPGDLLVTQRRATVPFTFNLPMTTPLRLRESLAGKIDLLGPPW